MAIKYKNLFSELKIGGIKLKNRIISAPMTYPILTADGCLTPEAIAFYELRAKGGAAVVTVSELIVDSKSGKYYPIQVITDAPNAKDSLAMAARAVRRYGAVASMELSHGGRFALTEDIPWGPSDVFEDGVLTVRAMTQTVIDTLVERYATAAALCRDAGFEMLLIHAGHGWLLQQFLSPSMNFRTDKYGGTAENRARLTLEVLDAVRDVVGKDFPIEVRMSAEEYIDGGYTFDEAIKFARLIESKIDLLQVSTGSHRGGFTKTHPSMFMPRGVNVHYAREMKKHVKIPVGTIGALGDAGMLEEIIKSGSADTVVMARALLADPYLPRKAMEGRTDEIVRCCRCYTCMAERLTTGLRVCALNPVIGSEYEHNFYPPAKKRKRILIAGGGPAGMECAVTAAERGHDVILCEKSDALGGALKAERGIAFKEDLFGFIAVKARQMERAGVDVRLNTEVTPELIKEFSPDTLVIAVGAVPVVPDIEGSTGENVIMADCLPDVNISGLGDTVIIGGGLAGCETAVHLASEGINVTVLEMTRELCPDANPRYRPILLEQMESTGLITGKTSARAVKITRDGVCYDKDGAEGFIKAKTVIIAAGSRPDAEAVKRLKDAAVYTEVIGDCLKPKNVAEAVLRGHFTAINE